MDINELLKTSVEKQASDVHLAVNNSPILRIHGDLTRLDMPKITQDDLNLVLKEILPERKKSELDENLNTDFGLEIEGLARFRVNIFNQRHGLSIVFRIIPLDIPAFDDLQLPEIFKAMCEYENGLVLVTGPTGSGKSTTLASMLDYINRSVSLKKHILTIEDPIEFVHESKHCLINQREVGQDASSFSDALRAALREDPDIILVGEMRDLETISLALTAAETGHLVFGTLHTNSAAKSIHRIVDVFPESQGEMVRSVLAESLQAIIAQRLIPKVDDSRVAVFEILVATAAVRNLIREEKTAQIYSAMQTGKAHGMCTIEQTLEQLRSDGVIAAAL